MSGPIQTIPQGLLGLLQLKELGSNPPVMVDSLSPNIDLTQLYLQRLMQQETGLFGGVPKTGAVVSAGHGNVTFSLAGTQVSVPQNEMWYCVAAGVIIDSSSPGGGNTVVAADTITAGLMWGLPGSITGYMMTPIQQDVISARARTWTTPPMTTPQWFGPGTTFWIVIFDILVAAGAYTFDLSMRAARIPI